MHISLNSVVTSLEGRWPLSFKLLLLFLGLTLIEQKKTLFTDKQVFKDMKMAVALKELFYYGSNVRTTNLR